MTCDAMTSNSLMCTEVLDLGELPATPQGKSSYPETSSSSFQPQTILEERLRGGEPPLPAYPELPLTVSAMPDQSQLADDRVLQNLLRNQDKYVASEEDFLSEAYGSGVNPGMRKIVAEWMLEVVHEQRSQPEVFALAMNLFDRFLAAVPEVAKRQLQLLGAVCILASSKIREPCPIPGKTLIVYTDYSITAEELKVRIGILEIN